jgi:hypothetical protein
MQTAFTGKEPVRAMTPGAPSMQVSLHHGLGGWDSGEQAGCRMYPPRQEVQIPAFSLVALRALLNATALGCAAYPENLYVTLRKPSIPALTRQRRQPL